MSIADQAQEDREYVRRLLKQKQPEFAAVLEQVVWELTSTRDALSAGSPASGGPGDYPPPDYLLAPLPVALLGAVAGDLGGELGAGGDVELGEHVGQVGLHGPARDVQPVADLGVG